MWKTEWQHGSGMNAMGETEIVLAEWCAFSHVYNDWTFVLITLLP